MEIDPYNYLSVLRKAFWRHYEDSTDVWTADQEMRVFPAVVQGRLKLPRSTRALDVGCGSGVDVEYFSRIYGSVLGLDLYAHAEWTAIQERAPNVRFACTDLLAYSSSGSFDLIVDNGCFHHQHPEQYQQYLGELAKLLASGGHFVVSTFKNAKITQRVDENGRLHRYFTDQHLRRELEQAGFEVTWEMDLFRMRHGDYYRLSFCRLDER